ncbi:MAG: hypothetical protein DMD66_14250 [Gemmatimonadetes bacterium]|nr:MAG: hypothetical protein DMD66_14250 [Gemmatimonadota bacterium]
MLNSNNTFVSTAVGSPQETWLRNDLAGTTKQCVLAIWHHPRFYSTTSSTVSPNSTVKPFWDDLYAAHAELIVNAQMRDYERFAPQNSAGTADPNGIRQFIVGTGGEGLDAPNTLFAANSEVNLSQEFGVLKLTLADGSYSWQFIPAGGGTEAPRGAHAAVSRLLQPRGATGNRYANTRNDNWLPMVPGARLVPVLAPMPNARPPHLTTHARKSGA